MSHDRKLVSYLFFRRPGNQGMEETVLIGMHRILQIPEQIIVL